MLLLMLVLILMLLLMQNQHSDAAYVDSVADDSDDVLRICC